MPLQAARRSAAWSSGSASYRRFESAASRARNGAVVRPASRPAESTLLDGQVEVSEGVYGPSEGERRRLREERPGRLCSVQREDRAIECRIALHLAILTANGMRNAFQADCVADREGTCRVWWRCTRSSRKKRLARPVNHELATAEITDAIDCDQPLAVRASTLEALVMEPVDHRIDLVIARADRDCGCSGCSGRTRCSRGAGCSGCSGCSGSAGCSRCSRCGGRAASGLRTIPWCIRCRIPAATPADARERQHEHATTKSRTVHGSSSPPRLPCAGDYAPVCRGRQVALLTARPRGQPSSCCRA